MRAEADGQGRSQVDRSKSRAWALQIHYLWEACTEASVLDALEQTLKVRTIARRRLPYVRQLLEALDRHLADIDVHLVAALDNWRIERLASIDRGVLRLAATEMIYLSDVPQHRVAWASPAVDPETGNVYIFTDGARDRKSVV